MPRRSALVFVLLFVACSRPDAIGRDVMNYANHSMPTLVPLEEARVEAQDHLSLMFKGDLVDRSAVLALLKERFIPASRTVLEKAKDIHPRTPEVQALHVLYVSVAQSFVDGGERMLAGIEKNDGEMVKSAKELINKGTADGKAWADKVRELGEKHGVKFPKK